MENHNNKVKMPTKKKSLSPLHIGMVVLTVCICCVLGVLGFKLTQSNTEVSNKNGVQEVVIKDEETLRKYLAEETESRIVISENIIVSSPIEIKGTKTLTGEHSIIMDLNTEAKSNMLMVTSGAHLIVDGAVLDGNGVVSAIKVNSGGKLDFVSGEILYPMPYGIVTAGVANVEDITIDRSMHTGIYVEAGGELYMTGGEILNCIQTGIATSTQAYAKVSGDVRIHDSAGSLFYNFGTLDITGGKYSDSFSNCIYNKGELNIVSETDDLVEFYNTGRSVISSVAGTTVNIDGLYVHDIAAHAMNLEKDSKGSVKNCIVENTGKSCFYTNGSKITMQDVELKDIKSVGINITNKSTAELENITIVNGGHRGIINDNSTVIMKNITADNLVGAGIITIGVGSNTTIDGAKISNVGKSGIGITGGTVNAKNLELRDVAGTAIYTISEMSKTTIDGADIYNSGKSAIGVSIGSVTANHVVINGTANTGAYVQKDAKLTLTNATMSGIGKHGIAVYEGYAVAENLVIDAPANAGILNQGTVTGTIVTVNKAGSRALSLTDESTTNINGLVIKESKYQSIYIDSAAQVHISNFNIDKAGQSAVRITKSKDVLFKTGTISNANGDGIWISQNAAAKVEDIVITSPTKYGVEVYEEAELTAVKVTVNAGRAGFINNGGTLIGKKLSVNNSESRSVNLIAGSTTSVTDLTINNAGAQGVYIDDVSKVVLKEIDIDTTEGAAIRASKSTDVSIKDGKIKNASTVGIYVCEKAAIKTENIKIDKSGTHGVQVVEAELTAIKVEVNTPTKAGFINVGGTIIGKELATNDSGSRSVSLTDGSTTSITGLKIKDAGDQGVYIDDVSKVVLKEIDIDTTKNAAIRVSNSKDVNIKTGTIENAGSDAVYVTENSAIKIEDVTVEKPTNFGLHIDGSGNEITAIKVGVNNSKAAVVNKAGTLVGKTITIDTTTSRAINLIDGGTTTVDGLTLKNAGDQGVYIDGVSKVVLKEIDIDTTKNAAIRVSNSKNVNIKTGTIENAGSDAVYVTENSAIKIEDVTVEKPTNYGLHIDGKGNEITAIKVGVNNSKAAVVNKGGTLIGKTITIDTTISRAMNLIDGGTTTVDGLTLKNAGDQGVYADNHKVTLKNFTIEKTKGTAIRLLNIAGADTAKLTSGTIKASNYGVAIGQAPSADNNNIEDKSTARLTDVRIIRDTNVEGKAHTKDLIWIMKNSVLRMQNGEDTAADKQGLVDGQKDKGYTGLGVNVEGTFRLDGGSIQNNEMTEEGAGVYVKEGATFEMSGGTIQENSTTNTSAGVAVRGTFKMSGGTIQKNKATKGAGVMVRDTGIFTMSGGTIKENAATEYGGGIYVIADTASNISGGTIEGNSAKEGAGIYIHNGKQLNMSGGTVKGNTSTGEGAGIYIKEDAVFTMSNGAIQKNSTGNTSGGVAVRGTFNMNGGSIEGNKASKGAGVMVRGTGVFTLTDGTIKENEATQQGGGVFAQKDFTMNGGTISDNTANGRKEDLFLQKNKCIILGTTLNSPIIITSEVYNMGIQVAKGTLGGSVSYLLVNKDSKGNMWYVDNDGKLAFGNDVSVLVNGMIYSNMEDAVKAANKLGEAATITIFEDQTISNTLNVTGDVTLVNGKTEGKLTITVADNFTGNMVTVASGAEFTVTGVEENPITLVGVKGSGSGIYNGGTMTLTNIVIDGAGTHGINNAGTLNGTNVTITNSGNRALSMSSGSTTKIDGLTIETTGHYGADTNRQAIDANAVTSAQITNFNITDVVDAAIRVRGDNSNVTLTNGTINATKERGIVTTDQSTVVAENVKVLRGDGNTNDLIQVLGSSQFTMKGSDSLVDGNNGTGIGVNVAGTFNLEGGTIQNNKTTTYGGGIYANNATVTMTGGTITSNESAEGGGVYLAGTTTMTMSGGTIKENTSTGEGAGIYIKEGAALTMSNGTIQKNSTENDTSGGVAVRGTFNMNGGSIEGNNAKKGAGVMVRGTGVFTLTDGTIKENEATEQGGGIFAQKNFTMNGGTITDNTAASHDEDIYLSAGKTIALGTKLASPVVITPASYTAGTVIATATENLAEYVKDLQVYSGSTGKAWCVDSKGKLAETSVSINGVGYASLEDAISAVGTGTATITIFEDQTISNTLNVTGDVTLENGKSEGNLTITAADGFTKDMVTVASGAEFTVTGLEGNPITLVGVKGSGSGIHNDGTMTLKNIVIDGAGTHGINNAGTLNGTNVTIKNSGNRALSMSSGSTTEIDGLTIETTGHYGAVENRQAIDANAVTSAQITNFNITDAVDAAIRVRGDNSNVTLTNGTINATKERGIVTTDQSTVVAENVKVLRGDGNTNDLIQVLGSSQFTMKGSDSLVDGNNGTGIGVNVAGTFNLEGGTIQNNKAEGYGGGVYANNATVTMTGGTISGNTVNQNNKAEAYGGGIYANNATVTMTGGTITSNESAEGGGVYLAGTTTMTMSGGTISENTVTGSGAGVSITGTAKLTMSGDASISGNTATGSGGGMIVRSTNTDGAFVMNGGTISGNTANVTGANGGGAIFQHKNTKIIMNSGNITGNTAKANGGGIWIHGTGAIFTMTGGSITENTAATNGGGIYAQVNITVNGGTIADNTAASHDEDIYLSAGKTIALGTKLASPVVITPASYTAGTVIATATENLAEYVKDLQVYSGSSGKAWYVDSEGKLAEASVSINGVGYASLEDAVKAANKLGEAATITLTDNQTISSTTKITGNVTLESTGAVNIKPSDTDTGNMFMVAKGATLNVIGTESNKISLTAPGKYVFENAGTLNLAYVDISEVSSAVFVDPNNTDSNVTLENVTIKDCTYIGVVIKAGEITLTNTILDNSGVSEAQSVEQIRGIYAEKCKVTVSNVTIQNFVGTKNICHGIQLVGTTLTSASDDNPSVTIKGVYGHGIYVTDGSYIQISNVIIDGAYNGAKKTRAGIQLTNSGSENDAITGANITNCSVQIQLKSSTVNINGTLCTETEGKATNYNAN